MTSVPDEAPAARLARARDAFAEISRNAMRSNLARLDELDRLWHAAGSDSLTEDERSKAVDVAHQLVGSAGTFGYNGASRLARRIEGYFAEQDFGTAAVQDGSRCLVQIRQQLLAEPDDEES